MDDGSESYLSCWTVKRENANDYFDNKSYLIDPAKITGTFTYLDMEPLTAAQDLSFISEGAQTCVHNRMVEFGNFD